MKTLTLLTTISILFSSVGYCEKVDFIDFEKEFNHLIDGMYEVESWFDGNKTHFPPFVSGRWVFYKGKIMSIIHNRIDSDNIKSSIRWGYGFFKDNTFNYSYAESINIKGTNGHSRINDIPLFSGLRKFQVKKIKNGFLMKANNETQTWEITENGMQYTDEKWGDEKIFVQRKWKRITPLN